MLRRHAEPRGARSLPEQEIAHSLAESVADRIRENVIRGSFSPGQHLSEAEMSESLEVSRNTLREVFRVLTKEGLLKHEPNRGVFVATPDVATIVDLYRVRRVIQCRVVEQSPPGHPAIASMRKAVDSAKRAGAAKDWVTVGSEDLAFHAAIVALADSPRLNVFFSQISAEMRLAFGLLPDPEYLHAPFIEANEDILLLVATGRKAEAAARLETYFVQAERAVLGAFSRR